MRKSLKVRLRVFKILIDIYKKNTKFDELFLYTTKSRDFLESDKAFINNVCLYSMRYKFHIDIILKLYLKKKSKTNEYILLLNSITQILYLNFKDYAVINDSVDVAKKINVYPGLINATLKKISSDKLRLKDININNTHLPFWFQKQSSGIEKSLLNKFTNTFFKKPNLHIVFKSDLHMKDFKENYFKSTNRSAFLLDSMRIEKIHNFKKGSWWVQDFSAMLPISLIKNLKEKKVVDLCSAPGGKTFQLLTAGKNITSNDRNAKRIFRLKENLKRLRFNSPVLNYDILKNNIKGKFDFVVLDAPCSSIGTIRKNPEIFFNSAGPEFNKIIKYQNSLLLQASKILKNNGILLYMVCSFFHSETTDQIKNFLKTNKEFSISKFDNKFLDKETKELIHKDGYIYIVPSYYKKFLIDGFFAVKLKKNEN